MKETVGILTAIAFAVGFGSLAKAQNSSITANATVISEIVVASVTNLNFGTVVAGQIKTIDSGDNVLVFTRPDLGGANRGTFTVAASSG